MSRSEETTDIVRPRGAASMRATQVFGLCFYWAWVYLSFNTTSSINLSLTSDQSLLWVHIASTIAGVITYFIVILFSRDTVKLFTTRRSLALAGALMSLGTACYALPVHFPLPMMIAGAAITGVTSPWIVIYWGTLYSKLSARNIVLCTAAAFFSANVIYFGSLLLPMGFPGYVTTAMPLCAALLIPDVAIVKPLFGVGKNIDFTSSEADRSEAMKAGGSAEDPTDRKGSALSMHRLIPLSRLPWRVALGLFVVMFVYGGVRIFVGVSDTAASDGLLPTVLLTFGVTILFIVWGFFFQGENASLGTVYKIMLPMLSTALLLMAIFGQQYVALMAVLATVCDITIEILSWMLLADIARTTRVPAFLVFAIGRMAVQGGMGGGQLTGWMCVGYIVPFAVVSIFALMLVMGFMFKDQDTLMVFEAPTPDERQNVEKLAGRSMDEHLAAIADAHGLTQREKEIFVLWATGHGSKYIQDTFTISAATVKTHVRHIYEKCGVHSRAEVIALLEQSR